jgi:hypothetical protein
MFSNLVLDLVDFKDRVRPLARDISLIDVARTYQKFSMTTLEEEREALKKVVNKI